MLSAGGVGSGLLKVEGFEAKVFPIVIEVQLISHPSLLQNPTAVNNMAEIKAKVPFIHKTLKPN